MEKTSKTSLSELRDLPPWPEVGEGGLDAGDVSLIGSMLARTPTQRLETLQETVDGLTALRDGRVADRPKDRYAHPKSSSGALR